MNHASSWVAVLHGLINNYWYNTSYVIVLYLHCALSFIEAPSGPGFRSGAGMGTDAILTLGGLCILWHLLDNVCFFLVGCVSVLSVPSSLSPPMWSALRYASAPVGGVG